MTSLSSSKKNHNFEFGSNSPKGDPDYNQPCSFGQLKSVLYVDSKLLFKWRSVDGKVVLKNQK